jgi:mannose-1-phosphate guanylyltransferase
MVESGVLFARSDDSYWLDTGTPAAFLAANHDLVSGRRAGSLAPGVTDRGDGVFVEGASAINGDVVGPSVIFGGCDIARGARVERSVLGPRSVIEAGAVVADSVLMEGSHVAADAAVTGSILGPSATVGQRADVRAVSVLGARSVVASGTRVDGERIAG